MSSPERRPIFNVGPESAQRIDRFNSRGAAAVDVGSGHGEVHVYTLHLEAGGEIGPHAAGFDQLFLVVSGRGWVAGTDGTRVELRANQATLIRKGEIHAKGANEPMTAVMIQIERVESPA